MILALSIFAWVIYSLSEGYREGWHWFYKLNAKDQTKTKAHEVWTLQRTMVVLLLCLLNSWWWLPLCMFTFPFMHDGAYYWHREKLKPGTYPKGFFDQSTSSTAFTTKYFTPLIRLICFLIGFVFLFF